METDEDAADQLVRGMHPDLLPPLVEFLEEDRRTRLAKRDPADVLRALFTPDELDSLLADAQQLNTSLWERLWNKAKRRPKGLTIMYALYLVDGYVEGSDEASYKAFVKAFAACKFPNYLVDDPERYDNGGWRIRVAGIGEGQDGQRLCSYKFMPKGKVTAAQGGDGAQCAHVPPGRISLYLETPTSIGSDTPPGEAEPRPCSR